jgi:hypothetical protein
MVPHSQFSTLIYGGKRVVKGNGHSKINTSSMEELEYILDSPLMPDSLKSNDDSRALALWKRDVISPCFLNLRSRNNSTL